MEAFNNLGNHLVSDSASTINAGDDVSTVDGDDNLLKMAGAPQKRQHDDGDEGLDNQDGGDDDDDSESLASAAVDGAGKTPANKAEEEKELPAHACW